MERRLKLVEALSHAIFVSIQADGSTDSGNIEDELFIAVYLNHNAIDKQVHIRNPFFTVRRLEHGDAQGLGAMTRAAHAEAISVKIGPRFNNQISLVHVYF